MKATRSLRSISSSTNSLPSRRWSPLLEQLTPTSAHRLSQTLTSFLPPTWIPSIPPLSSSSIVLTPGYHLVYFNPVLGPVDLLPDGTDRKHSPGGPFVRRMWAGGRVRFVAGEKGKLKLDGSAGVCVERIRDVLTKGKEGEEKIFVGIERRLGVVGIDETGQPAETEEQTVERIWRDEEDDFGDAQMIERRNIVFMRERTPQEMREALQTLDRPRNARVKKPELTPSFSHTLIPTPSLLFRYSALTFNAHSIHLDPHYCRTVEGHRNLLVHGPLTCTLLMTMLQAQVQQSLSANSTIASFDYRNIAPLYAGEEMKLCGSLIAEKEGTQEYRLWAENGHGDVAVKATAKVVTS